MTAVAPYQATLSSSVRSQGPLIRLRTTFGAWYGFPGSFKVSVSSSSAAIPSSYAQANPQLGDEWLAGFLELLDKMKGLRIGWNGYSAPKPSRIAIEAAKNFLASSPEVDLRPTRVAPSAVGGVGITYRREDSVVYVEFYNDGRAYALFSGGDEEERVRPIRVDATHEPFQPLVDEIQGFLDE